VNYTIEFFISQGINEKTSLKLIEKRKASDWGLFLKNPVW
jgi:hypothetical protein